MIRECLSYKQKTAPGFAGGGHVCYCYSRPHGSRKWTETQPNSEYHVVVVNWPNILRLYFIKSTVNK